MSHRQERMLRTQRCPVCHKTSRITWDLYRTVEDCTEAKRKEELGFGYTCYYWDNKKHRCRIKACRYSIDGINMVPPMFFKTTEMIDLSQIKKEG